MVNIKEIKEKLESKNYANSTNIIEEEYDGSYVLSQFLASLYANQCGQNDDWEKDINYADINLIYCAATISSKDNLYKFIDETSLSDEYKTQFKNKLEEVFEKFENGVPYVNNQESRSEKTTGMIGRGMNVTIGSGPEGNRSYYWALIKLVIKISNFKKTNQSSDPMKLLNFLNENENKDLFCEAFQINKTGENTLSAILHCNYPSAFPIINGTSKEAILELIKPYCGKRKIKIKDDFKEICELMIEHYPCKNYRDLDKLITDCVTSETEEKVKRAFLNGSKQIILTGAPGTGKTFSAKNVANNDESAATISDNDESMVACKYQFVQFHPSFDYTDFVEGLRPVQLNSNQDPTFVRMDGVFKDFCRQAATSENDVERNNFRYYFIIDEINRADLSKVFGELMYCLEYRGKEGRVKTQYHNLDTYVNRDNGPVKLEPKDDVFKDGFYIPENVYIIGTMNDIDRSVESFDFALRRRFKWIEVMTSDVNETILKSFVPDKEKRDFILVKLKSLNNYIAHPEENGMGLSEAYQIGAAYFKNIDSAVGSQFKTKVLSVYENDIEATLKEYVRGRDQNSVDKFIQKCREEFGLEPDKGKDGLKWKKNSEDKGATETDESTNAAKDSND